MEQVHSGIRGLLGWIYLSTIQAHISLLSFIEYLFAYSSVLLGVIVVPLIILVFTHFDVYSEIKTPQYLLISSGGLCDSGRTALNCTHEDMSIILSH